MTSGQGEQAHGLDRRADDGDTTADHDTLAESVIDLEDAAGSDRDAVANDDLDTVVDDDQHDHDVDDELDRLDDGGSVVGVGAPGTTDARSEALPFVLTAREHFASVGDVAITGDARVDAATARLDEIPDLPTSDHVAVYDDVHRRLQDTLSDAEVR